MNFVEGFAAGIAMATVTTVICDWFSDEIRTRLERLPRALIKAILRLAPPEMYAQEWDWPPPSWPTPWAKRPWHWWAWP